ncbi:MAG: extracellular solute-binding protein [Candidatus Pacebacteria bacterium]|nr:extracellular solute-binding protein [Candidatus Paceibacterota bacterium]
MRFFTLLITIFAWLPVANIVAEPQYAIGLYGSEDVKLGPDEPWPYVNPNAPKGGHLNMRTRNFTTLNPHSLKGLAAPLLGLVFETPTTHSYAENEPFTEYGHLVESIDIADDRMSLVYKIRPEARFSDGEPVTADDFVFSVEIMDHPEYSPVYRQYFRDIEKATKIDDLTVRITFRQRNQELPLITGQMPILPEHVYGADGTDFGKDFDTIAVGSGPYVVEDHEFGKYITVKRDISWWGRKLPKSAGCYNFDTITAKVFLDDTSEKEAFKGGVFDVMLVTVSKDWALDFRGPFVKKNYIMRREIPHKRPVGMQGFAFNLRNPIFQSLKTRYALALVFNFPWMNKNLFYNQYTRTRCFFENSPDMTNVSPPEGRMLQYLTELREKYGEAAVPKMALFKPLTAPGQEKPAELTMKQASLLLDSVGWRRGPDGIRVRDGKRLSFELLLSDRHWQRIAEPYQKWLRQLGAEMTTDVAQPAEFQKRTRTFDFDMIVMVYTHSRSVGNEQLYYFGSKAADIEGSRNVNGLKNPAVDEVLEHLVSAETREELVFYGQVLDRILTASTIVVPHWHLTYDRTLVWNKFGEPETHCSQLMPETVVRNYWWFDPQQAQRLKDAMADGKPLPAAPVK